ncbi:hypothetical protein [Micromonospora sp. NBC_01796]|uniref:hypothetical protein n=1 Tax=Micromonospora sp. NBC_01796 TaxID=2975987 RepID=UPI002DDAE2B1|nr:hypothetical protein [Micromonospora sp. NBC_01796]WSA88080.1 hypothetical protein OIE47_10975 [Micromonospora sp. NBC_01796]
MAGRELSRRPDQIRKRLARGMNVDRDYAAGVEVGIIKPVEEWDPAELAHGRPRASDGSFRGATPKWITPKVIAEAQRRLKSRARGLLLEHVESAAKVLGELMRDPNTDDRVRADIAKFTIDHAIGKAQIKVDADISVGPRDFLVQAIMVEDEHGQLVDAHPVVDGQFYETDDEEDDDG